MRKSKSSLFLMELIIVIFFFALTSAVCLQVFARAHDIAKETEAMNQAALWADNAAECFYEYEGDEERVSSTLRNAFSSDLYTFDCEFFEDEQFRYMTFTFKYLDGSGEIYRYTFKANIKEVL